MATFTTAPSYGSSLTEEPRVLSNEYGDGYEARTGNGINKILQVWALTFSNRTRAQADALIAFFRNEEGITSFDWTPPRGVAGKYVAKQWQQTPGDFDNETVTVLFKEVRE